MDEREYSELLDFLAQTPGRVAALAGALPADALPQRPAPESFSALEQACHLRDIERDGYGIRIRRILDEDEPVLPGINGARLAAERDYLSQDLAAALAEFAAARAESLLLLRQATPAQRLRGGRFGDEVVPLHGIAGMMRQHDSEHVQELEAIRDRFKR